MFDKVVPLKIKSHSKSKVDYADFLKKCLVFFLFCFVFLQTDILTYPKEPGQVFGTSFTNVILCKEN